MLPCQLGQPRPCLPHPSSDSGGNWGFWCAAQGTAASILLPWVMSLALTCPLCCSPGCSRFGGVRSHIAPIPARASRTKRQQTAMQTLSWRWRCSTASCSLQEEKRTEGPRAQDERTRRSWLCGARATCPNPTASGTSKCTLPSSCLLCSCCAKSAEHAWIFNIPCSKVTAHQYICEYIYTT